MSRQQQCPKSFPWLWLQSAVCASTHLPLLAWVKGSRVAEWPPSALPCQRGGMAAALGLRWPGGVHAAPSRSEAGPSSGLSHGAGEERVAGHG